MDDISGMGFDHLKRHRAEIESANQQQPGIYWKLRLRKLDEEIAARTRRIVGKVNGQIVAEFNRWRTDADCTTSAEKMGIPIGSQHDVDGQIVTIEIEAV